jgi:hypothetical protein
MQTLTDFLQRAWKVRRPRITERQLRSEMLLDGLDGINKNGINSPLGKGPLGFAKSIRIPRRDPFLVVPAAILNSPSIIALPESPELNSADASRS